MTIDCDRASLWNVSTISASSSGIPHPPKLAVGDTDRPEALRVRTSRCAWPRASLKMSDRTGPSNHWATAINTFKE